MKRLRRTLTFLFLFSTVLGLASITVSCNQQGNKQTQDTNKVSQTGQPETNHMVQNGAPASYVQDNDRQKSPGSTRGQNPNHQAVQAPNSKRDTSDKSNKMLNAYEKRAVEDLGPVKRVFTDPDQKRSQDLLQKGSGQLKNDDYQGAIESFTLSLNLFRYAVAYLERGVAELLAMDYVSAENDMNEAIKMNPELDKAYFNRGICHFELNEFQAAEEDMKKYVEKEKTNPIAYNYIAGCLYLHDDIKGALENYQIVAKLDPNYPDVYTNSGMMKHYLKDLKGALEDYNKALAIDPKNATAYNNRGAAKLGLGNAKDALGDFNKAIEINLDYADAYDNRGKAKISLGDNAGACADWQRAISLGLETTKTLVDKYCK
jgi:tetratricopeptide (TPR) repeat protein